ncbi:DUF47 domain-containing protein [Clostridium paraputrificum]|uniref:DUF47 domain-containing protein n=1 Tax=Clostridium paraputrificum TaxID=29363 RepID=UPI003D3517B2
MLNFSPKEDKFYEMISDSSKNVNDAAKILRENLDSLHNKEVDVIKTEAIEKKGDELVRIAIKELNEAFITPIDREDIYEILKVMHKILDLISSTMHRFIMFDIKESTEESKLLGDMLVQITKELMELMDELKVNGCKSKDIEKKIIKVSAIEHDADMLFRRTVSELFKKEENTLTVMKWKEIYQIIEDTIDYCEKVANIVEGVVIKNA